MLFPADRGCLRNHGETRSLQFFSVSERAIDAAVSELLMALDASGVYAQQHGHAVTSAPGAPPLVQLICAA